MKIIEDEGNEITQVPDGTAMLLLLPDRTMVVLMEETPPDEQVPQHTMLAAALAIWLKDRENVAEVLSVLPSARRRREYKGN